MKTRLSNVAAVSLFFALAVAVYAADTPTQVPRLDPQNLIYTFFPVTMLQSFVGISDPQAAKIFALEAKLSTDLKAVKDDGADRMLKAKASDDVKAVLLPDQIEKLARCALEIQILTNTFGHDKLENVTFSPAQMLQVQPIMADAVSKRMQIDQEYYQEMEALPAQASMVDRQKLNQERNQKIKAMREGVRTSISALLTDTQKAALDAAPAAV